MFKQRQPASSKNVNVVVTIDRNHPEKTVPADVTSWTKIVMDLYTPGTLLR